MSNAALNWAQRVRGISGTSKAVLMHLANMARDNTNRCWPSITRLAADACLSERTTQEALRKLQQSGLIMISRGGGRCRTSVYAVMVGKGELAAETEQEMHPYEVMDTVQIPQETVQHVPETVHLPRDTVQQPHPNPVEPSRTQKNPKRRERESIDSIPLPAWLPPDAWEDWCAHRQGLSSKGWTTGAATRCISTLAKLRDQGNDPREVIDQSIAGGWTGLFALKSGQSRSGFTSKNKLDYLRPDLRDPEPSFDFDLQAEPFR